MSIETWIAFFAASWLISLSPGPGAISCMAAGMRYGYRAGLWNILGLQLGIVLLVAIVAVGLGALLAASTLAVCRGQMARRSLSHLARHPAVARRADGHGADTGRRATPANCFCAAS